MKTSSVQNDRGQRTARVTIGKLAKEAGVSVSTVSHAFSNKRTISKEVKERIFAIAERCGYRPNFAAQALATKRTNIIEVLVREATEQYFPLYLQAIATAAHKRGYRISVGLTGSDSETTKGYLDSFVSGQCDGMLVLSTDVSNEQIIELTERGYFVGTPSRIIPNYEYVSGVELDIRSAFRKVLQHLYNMGHREFGFIGGKPNDLQGRYEEMHHFVSEYNLNFSPTRQVTDIESSDQSQVGITEMLSRHPEITAIACSNDTLAVGAMMGALDNGYRIPEDVSITGFDDVPISRYCYPRLTTVRIPIDELSLISVNNLLDRIEGCPLTPRVRLPLELIIRDSTGVPRNTERK